MAPRLQEKGGRTNTAASPSALHTVGSMAGGQGHASGLGKDQSTKYLANGQVENGN